MGDDWMRYERSQEIAAIGEYMATVVAQHVGADAPTDRSISSRLSKDYGISFAWTGNGFVLSACGIDSDAEATSVFVYDEQDEDAIRAWLDRELEQLEDTIDAAEREYHRETAEENTP